MDKTKLNILHMTPDFSYSDGRSYYVYLVLKYLKRAGHNVFLCTNGGDSVSDLNEFRIPSFVHSSLSKKTSFIDSVKFISGIVSSNKIDIIHSHHRFYELLAKTVSKRKRVGTVFTSLSIVDKRYFVEYSSDRIIAVSNCVKEMLTGKFNVKESKISLLPNFVDSEDLSAKGQMSDVRRQSSIVNRQSGSSKLKTENQKFCILSVGRFHKEKDFITLLKAISLLKDLNIKLMMIGEGEGDEKENYLKIIEQNSLYVEFISPRRYIGQYFNNADICVLSSIRDPLPGFMFQSGLHSKPFIGSNTDGIPEVIVNYENGLLFEKRDSVQLAENIRLFINDPDLARKCAENLHKLVLKSYTEKKVMPELENLYTDLMKEKFNR